MAAIDCDRQSTVAVNDGGPPLTTVGPSPDHLSMVVNRQSIGGSGRVMGRFRSGNEPGQVGSWVGSVSGPPRGLLRECHVAQAYNSHPWQAWGSNLRPCGFKP
uniref:Uncharacterized protein n=1 Tax=Tanacetum cinerariifolium TaxID=118510 RepID=A0A699SEC6_TANCI|nr:hypothetical protein [Tanacetum cinerariifolium]